VTCPEDIEPADFISSRDGNNERTFRCSVDVRTALHQAGMLTDGTESLIDALDEGTGCDIPVTEEQYSNFYGKGRQQEPV
jgi:hypothetical protein